MGTGHRYWVETNTTGGEVIHLRNLVNLRTYRLGQTKFVHFYITFMIEKYMYKFSHAILYNIFFYPIDPQMERTLRRSR